MGLRLDKPWRALTEEEVADLTGQLGVYQIADARAQVLFIGMAGGRSLFGLRGELERQRLEREPGTHGTFQFRVEVNMSYLSRCQELLMLHAADHGELPPENVGRLPFTLGRLSPL